VKRLRLLAGLLGCLAVLAAAFVTVAASPVLPSVAASEPCDHCPDCKGLPCAPVMVNCAPTCIAMPPALMADAIMMSPITASESPWLALPVALRGLTRPPDPFPPRV
jgi:hypothetical protein